MGHGLVPSIGVALAAIATAAAGVGTLGPGEADEPRTSPSLERVEVEPRVEESCVLHAPRLRGRRRHRLGSRDQRPVMAAIRDAQDLREATHHIEVESRAKAAAEVRDHVERGLTHEGMQSFDAAVTEYRKALSILSWYSDQRDFGVTTDRVRDMIGYVERKALVHEHVSRRERIRAAQMEQESIGERERRLRERLTFFDEAHRAFRRGEYVLAREYARRILLLDPQNADAEQLIAISHDAQHERHEAASRHLFDDKWKAVFADLHCGTVIATVDFPEDWLGGIASQARDDGDTDPKDDEVVRELLRSRRVRDVSWEATSLDQVTAYLRTLTGVPVVLSPEVRCVAPGVVEITLDLDDVTIEVVLDLITEPYALRWVVEDGHLQIHTVNERERGLAIRFVDIADLEAQADHPATDSVFPEPDAATDGPLGIDRKRALVTLIRDAIGGAADWEEPGALEIRNQVLILRGDPPTIERVMALLEDVRRAGGLGTYLKCYRWSTVTGAPPRPRQK